ncbi:MAG: hypothetical protein M3Y40_02995, partial [Chloroflexota bacterium]|nr:hypothetical protein [Chloroflexota bacterium]
GIQYRAARGLGFVCVAAGAGATQLMVETDTWTGLRAPESPRDLYIFSEGASADDEADDSWVLVTVTAAARVANGCGA